ncbi:uncharacterized protein JCM15063_001801 [Sporobolomyces koalae]|uniref:uncharacterized protein n=1 Tax=Sporobolomyces koalae TaxID=500713 RepID=UPI00317FA006
MADVFVYLVAYLGHKAHRKVLESRSPVIPTSPPRTPSEHEDDQLTALDHSDLAPEYSLPPVDPASGVADSPPLGPRSLSTPAAPTPRSAPRARSHSQTVSGKKLPKLTEHGLREVHTAWKLRYNALFLRLAALLDAQRQGQRCSWAGLVSSEKCDEVRLAVLEAEYVEKKLAEAVAWCEEKGLQRLPLVALVSSKRRSSEARPTHAECPPSLVDMPSPLPPAPPAVISRLTVSSVPPWVYGPATTRPDDAAAHDLPPVYERDHDPLRGERLIERATWDEHRVSDGADQVVLIRR